MLQRTTDEPGGATDVGNRVIPIARQCPKQRSDALWIVVALNLGKLRVVLTGPLVARVPMLITRGERIGGAKGVLHLWKLEGL